MSRTATVHLLAGLNGAGKTTHARALERDCPAVRFTLDEWMIELYRLPYDDPAYPDLATRCQNIIWSLAQQILAAGTDVVLDWNHWSRQRRQYWGTKAREAGHDVVVHHLTTPLTTAIEQVERRNADQVAGAHVLDADAVRHLADLFEAPDPDEGFPVRPVSA